MKWGSSTGVSCSKICSHVCSRVCSCMDWHLWTPTPEFDLFPLIGRTMLTQKKKLLEVNISAARLFNKSDTTDSTNIYCNFNLKKPPKSETKFNPQSSNRGSYWPGVVCCMVLQTFTGGESHRNFQKLNVVFIFVTSSQNHLFRKCNHSWKTSSPPLSIQTLLLNQSLAHILLKMKYNFKLQTQTHRELWSLTHKKQVFYFLFVDELLDKAHKLWDVHYFTS